MDQNGWNHVALPVLSYTKNKVTKREEVWQIDYIIVVRLWSVLVSDKNNIECITRMYSLVVYIVIYIEEL